MKRILLGLAALHALHAFSAVAQTYPARPIRVLVGFQPGGGVDISARAIGQKLSDALGQSVVVDNRPGASGNIAADIVAKSAPDGYTLLMANSTISIPALFVKLPFDVTKDLAPVSLVAMGPSVLVVHPSVPIKNVKELMALARKKPKELIFGSGGPGNITHLAMELFMSMAKIDMIHVPYKGGAPSVIGLLSGEVHMLFTSIPSVLGQIKIGKVRAIGVSIQKRSSALPAVPTIDEAGLPGFNTASWYGLLAPAGVPQNILELLSKEVVKIMHNKEIRDRFARDGFEPVGNTPGAFGSFIRSEIPKWGKVVRQANIKPQ